MAQCEHGKEAWTTRRAQGIEKRNGPTVAIGIGCADCGRREIGRFLNGDTPEREEVDA